MKKKDDEVRVFVDTTAAELERMRERTEHNFGDPNLSSRPRSVRGRRQHVR